jgi:trk system potassium uptake protein TrkH
MAPRQIAHFSPGRILLISLCCAITIGAFLLSLPMARFVPMSWIDLFFTSASVTCVTGLLTVPLADFTPFGQCIILCLMQIGGIGLITLSLFLMSLFIEFGLGAQILAGKLLEFESWKNMKSMLFFIINLTLTIELIGALIFLPILLYDYQLPKALFLSIFHAVSSFCDAGLTLFPSGMVSYQASWPMLLTTSVLMLLGGIGFITLHELLEYAKLRRAGIRSHLSLHTKIVLWMTLLIVSTSVVLFWVLERNNTLSSMSTPLGILNAFFNAISSRSTGFTTISTFELNAATIFMILIIAFIGSSPGSTGSGIRTTTFALFLATIKSAIMGQPFVHIKGRRIPLDQIFKAVSIVALSQAWITATIFCLLITEKGWDFFNIVIEVVSAYTTLGFDTGGTPHLSFAGKIFIIAAMIIGRVGSLTVVLALKKKMDTADFKYPEERVMLT